MTSASLNRNAHGDVSRPALLLRGGRIADVNAGRFVSGDVLVSGDTIAEVGPGAGTGVSGDVTVIDVQGKFVLPGFIDPHLHIESSMVTPLSFAAEALRHGTCAAFVDPHEIANVAGPAGVDLFLDMAACMPLSLYVAAPSCVPATDMEDAGGRIDLDDIRRLLGNPQVYGLGEMMNFPAIIHGFGDARERVDAAIQAGKVADGHCPGVTGDDLVSYVTNGRRDGVVRIATDHECTTADEVLDKLAVGMTPALRYGSASPDIDRILPQAARHTKALDRCMFCSDDLDPCDLAEKGHVDRILNRAVQILIEEGNLEAEQAFLIALAAVTRTPAQCYARFFRLTGRSLPGAIAAGRRADLVVANRLRPLEIETVISGGTVVVSGGEALWRPPAYDTAGFRGTVHLNAVLSPERFRVEAPAGASQAVRVRVIGAEAGSLLTEHLVESLPVVGGVVHPDPERDIALLAVLERHRGSGRDATAFVRGLGLRSGAVASTVAHDSHNLIVAGVEPEAMVRAAALLVECGGGMACVARGTETVLPLPVGGLMSEDSVGTVAEHKRALLKAAALLGPQPRGDANIFMTLSFLALPVIPHLKLTNRGLVDVDRFEHVPLFAD